MKPKKYSTGTGTQHIIFQKGLTTLSPQYKLQIKYEHAHICFSDFYNNNFGFFKERRWYNIICMQRYCDQIRSAMGIEGCWKLFLIQFLQRLGDIFKAMFPDRSIAKKLVIGSAKLSSDL